MCELIVQGKNMKLNRIIKKGREIFYGTGTREEVESLNVAKDFETTLNILGKIRNTRRFFLIVRSPDRWIGQYMAEEKCVNAENDVGLIL